MTGLPPPAAAIPPPLDSDDDDVAWALQTAQVQWKLGAFQDALVWLRRAVDSAIDAGHPERAAQINRLEASLAEQLSTPADNPFENPFPPGPLLSATDDDDEDLDDMTPVRSEVEDQTLEARDVSLLPYEIEDVTDLPEANEVDELVAASIAPEPAAREEEPTERRFPRPPSAAPRPVRPVSRAPLPSRAPVPPATRPGRAQQPPPRVKPLPSRVPTPPPGRSARPAAMARSTAPRSRVETPLPVSVEPVRDEEVVDTVEEVESAPPPPIAGVPGPVEVRSEPPPPFEEAPYEPAAPSEPTAVTAPPKASEPPPPPEPSEPPPPPEPSEPEEAAIGGIELADVPGLQDLPEDAQLALVRQARIVELAIEEEISSFGVVLVLDGWVNIMPTVADAACARARRGDVVFTRGTLEENIALRVVAGHGQTRVAVWEDQALSAATADCPWVADELREVADRFQALAGACMGPMGDRLDDSLRSMVTDKCEVRQLLPGEVILERGKPMSGLFIVGAGKIEIVDEGGSASDQLGPGDFVFAAEMLGGGAAPAGARAGGGGALVLFAERRAAHELMVVVPPLLEILAG